MTDLLPPSWSGSPLLQVAAGLLLGFALGVLVFKKTPTAAPVPAARGGGPSAARPTKKVAATARPSRSMDPVEIDEDDGGEESEEGEEGSSEEWSESDESLRDYVPQEEHKMVLVVRTDLKMKPGKVAAQCCHAALGTYLQAMRLTPRTVRFWERTAAAKVALKVTSEEELRALQAAAKAQGLPCYLVTDAGRTQIAAGSRTVLGIGPAPKSLVDRVTGDLRLF
ncbi:MAG: aminoacyl-tRNA hydrolase [archaeon]|nr:aminoacyl-tRNA hydrolase [archaeon]